MLLLFHLTNFLLCFRLQLQSPCVVDDDCIPAHYRNNNISIGSSIISCNASTGICVCKRCFVRVRDVCQLNNNTCERFDVQSEDCIDDRKSQSNALLLSAFLSATGAANFYIGQYTLGLFISVQKSIMYIIGRPIIRVHMQTTIV